MAIAPKPVKFAGYTASDSTRYPAQPLQLVGPLPTGALSGVAVTAPAAAVGTVGATYTATEQATIQNLQTTVNALRTALLSAGILK